MTDEIHAQGENLVVVYRAPDEMTAHIVHGLLISEGIMALIQSRQVPMYDGAIVMGLGYWGDVVVPQEYADQSRKLIEAYHQDK